MYLLQKIFFVNSFCMHIAQNMFFQKKEEAIEIQRSQNKYFCLTPHKISIRIKGVVNSAGGGLIFSVPACMHDRCEK